MARYWIYTGSGVQHIFRCLVIWCSIVSSNDVVSTQINAVITTRLLHQFEISVHGFLNLNFRMIFGDFQTCRMIQLNDFTPIKPNCRWELFSLGTTPYPGMDADQNLFIKLQDGYRMDQPEYATQEVSATFTRCLCFYVDSYSFDLDLWHHVALLEFQSRVEAII